MYKFLLYRGDEDHEVYVNLISSSAGTYLSRRPHIIALIKELLSSAVLKGGKVVIEKDLGRDIGTTDILTTSDNDNIYYARPLKSEVYSRFAKNRYAQPSSLLTIILVRDDEGNYEVIDTWIGANHPAFPGDKDATNRSYEYWKNHALVQDAQVIQSKSITKTWPY